jgi:ubiquinone/menaquinone biosynthesis C-methylase UbiE
VIEKTIYNTIGKTYDTTRQADPEIISRLFSLLKPQTSGIYLDIACGSGNYTSALVQNGMRMVGIDISDLMLSKAHAKYPAISFLQSNATKLSFQDNTFNGACCILATHHIKNNLLLFQEAFRVIGKGNFVIFTATPEQMSCYWLCHYFSYMIKDSLSKMTSFEQIQDELNEVGFVDIQSYPFFVTNHLQDLFLYSGKCRPEIYLDPTIRSGISSFHLSTYEDELKEGLKNLEADILSGQIKEIIHFYENRKSDYMYIVATKD